MSLIYVKRMRFKSAIVFPSDFVCSRSSVSSFYSEACLCLDLLCLQTFRSLSSGFGHGSQVF